MRAPKWPRSRRTIDAERDAAEARALGWQRELLTERAAHGRTRDLVAQTLGIATGPGIKVDVAALVEVLRAVRARADIVNHVRTERDAAQAHASHWRREVGALTGVQSEGMADSDLLRRLRQVVDDGTRAQQVADRARDDEEAAYEAIRRVANALRPGSSGVRVDDVVEWAREASDADSLLASREALLRQAEQFEAELEAIRAELRATGHPIGTRGLSYDVDAAIDRERSRAQDLVERLADVLGWPTHPIWPMSAPHIIRELAVRLGKPMPARAVRWSDWGSGSRTARELACTCRGDRGRSATSIVDPRCPEHSPGYRFGGWPVRPLALGWARSRYGFDALDVWDGSVAPGGWVCDVCRFPVESEPCREHQPKAYAEMREGVPF